MLAIGIDLGGTNIKGALVDPEGTILNKSEIPTLAQEGPDAVIQRIAGLILALIEAASEPQSIKGIGIGVPGQPDKTGAVLYASNLGWENVPLVRLLKKRIKLPISLDNDANTAALAEFKFGAGRGAANMVAITIGTGIGAGIILDGRLYRGSAWSAGELGHSLILPNGPACTCGRRGCLETLTAAPALVRMAREKLACGRKSNLAEYSGLEARDIFLEAEKGDNLAQEIIDTMVCYLGMGLGNIVNILNPDI